MTGPRTEAYERLCLDGGWLTAAQLAMETGQAEGTVYSSLRRQAQRGYVERRVIDLALADAPDGFNDRDQPRRNRTLNRRVEFKAL